MKKCTKCSIEKPLENFSKSKVSKDGHHPHCKECDRNRVSLSYQENSSRINIDLPSGKICPRCLLSKSPSEFARSISRKSGLNTFCKDCCRKANRDFKEKVWESLGGPVCRNCGEIGLDFLTLQHKLGGGRQHRRKSSNWYSVFKEVISDPDRLLKYEVLCANCNMIESIRQISQDRIRSIKSDVEHDRVEKSKIQAFSILSGGVPKCHCCGFDDMNALCIDHKIPYSQVQEGPRRGTTLHRMIISDSSCVDRYQVLCFNCNLSKGITASCIHMRGIQY